ncbi:MAG TPA: nicotinate phosphoribosyltransferase [Acidimicrobiales bacterium]|nr:nicotinate phosphoribosyltransferase [Acidimicrobiales bacterium]
MTSTALLTDHYELTMLDAALRSGAADIPAVFEVFARRLPAGRRAGVFAGLGRLLDALEEFTFGPEELAWLEAARVVSAPTLEWLSRYRFGGDIDAYREGEWYTVNSPVVTVTGTFAETVLLETLVLSILNHDTAVASAASLIVGEAGDRPVIEMGSRRTDPSAAVAAARAAYLGGFASTSNLEAGRRYGIPTAGTAAHSFTLVHPSERDAFTAQVAALGPGTTLLVDTFDVEQGIRTAVEVAGPRLGAIRIDSGDLEVAAHRARKLLDGLGATSTRIVITGDLDDRLIRRLADAPADGYGVGTNVVMGLGAPTAGFVYKLVSVEDAAGGEHAVAKRSPGKAGVGGRKQAWRARLADGPVENPLPDRPVPAGGWLADVVSVEPDAAPRGGRPLQSRVVEKGQIVDPVDLAAARAWHATVRGELGADEPLVLARR